MMTMRIPQITLDRLDQNLHIRIVEKSAAIGCDPGTGRLTGADPYSVVAGRNVIPNERCDGARWTQIKAMYGNEATPTDSCFSKDGGRQAIRVPGGKTYVVLVEGSGRVAGAGGGMQTITLGSGCAEVRAEAGATVSVSIDMQEQADRGRCGDSRVSSDEVCDEGMPTPTCNARCRIPEQNFMSTVMSDRQRPRLAWAMGQSLVLGFHTTGMPDNPYLRFFDTNGFPISVPAILSRDNDVDAIARSEQSTIAVAASPTGIVAAWQTFENAAWDINGYMQMGYDAPNTQQLLMNPTSTGPGANGRINPAVALSSSAGLYLFEDADAHVIKRSLMPFSGMPTMPMADAPLVAAGMMGASDAANPVVVARADGTFVAGWVSGTPGNKDVFAVQVSAQGAAMGAPIMINSQTGNDQDQLAVASNGTDVVFAWRDGSGADPLDTSGTSIRWRHFGAGLAPSSMDRVANVTAEGNQSLPTVAMTPGGTVLIAWAHEGGTIRGRLFKTDGSLVVNRFSASTGDFEVNADAAEMSPTGGMRTDPSAAFGGSGRFAVAWRDNVSATLRLRVFVE
jgi:hypothetical protein